jgi:pimeloyl-ACP methyl ester carboxylesterase
LTWFKQLRYFAKYTEIYAYDILGHGKSDNPQVEYTAQLFVEVLRTFIKKLSIVDPILVGHSLGGIISQAFALKYPDLVQKLVLLCTGAFISLGGRPLNIPHYLILLLRKLISKLLRWSIYLKILVRMSAKRRIEGIKVKSFEARMAASCAGKAMLSIVYHLVKFNISKEINTLKLPILFITGTRDIFLNQVPIYRTLPNVKVKIKPGGEHVLHLYNGEVDNWILEFIKE